MSLILIHLLLIIISVTGYQNILFIIIDDLRPELGIYNGKAFTPNIDKIGNNGVLFNHAYAQQALCAPSRNSFLTSRRPDTLRLYDFYSYWRDVAGNFTTLPQHLKQSGYDTLSIGKVFHPGESSNFTDDAPYSWSSKPWHPSSQKYKDAPVCFSEGRWHKNVVCPVVLEDQPEKTLPDIQSTAEAVDVLRNRSLDSKPFFLIVGYHKPHIPLKFPRDYLDFYPLDTIDLPIFPNKPPDMPSVAWNPYTDLRSRDDIAQLNLSFPYGKMPDEWTRKIRQAYYASITYIDDQIGLLLEALKESRLEKNTIIILLGDNGWSLGEHGEWAKYSNFEVSVRVPLIVSVPNLTSGRVVKDIVELVDIFPTVVQLLGLEELPVCRKAASELLCTEGLSFLPVLRGRMGEKKVAFSQYPRPGETPTKNPNSDKPRLQQIRVMGYSVRTRIHRYTLWVSWSPEQFSPDWTDVKGVELYDHLLDPDENENLAGRSEMADVESRLKTKLQRHFRSNSKNKLRSKDDLI